MRTERTIAINLSCCGCYNNNLVSVMRNVTLRLMSLTNGEILCNICVADRLEMKSMFFLTDTIRRLINEADNSM